MGDYKKVINLNQKEINFYETIPYMDYELREKLHSQLAPCTEQEFFSAYEKEHMSKFGHIWSLSNNNLIW